MVEEMDAELIRRWNEFIAPEDIVLHLGDLALGSIAESLPLTAQLHGRRFLVPGNHDRVSPATQSRRAIERFAPLYEEAGWEILPEIIAGTRAGQRILASHYPYTGDTQGEDRHTSHRAVDRGLPPPPRSHRRPGRPPVPRRRRRVPARPDPDDADRCLARRPPTRGGRDRSHRSRTLRGRAEHAAVRSGQKTRRGSRRVVTLSTRSLDSAPSASAPVWPPRYYGRRAAVIPGAARRKCAVPRLLAPKSSVRADPGKRRRRSALQRTQVGHEALDVTPNAYGWILLSSRGEV